VPSTTVNGCDFHFELDDFADPWIEADTVWLQHGFGRSSRFWYQWPPLLAADYRVIRRDMRGHGQSTDPGRGFEFTRDLLLADMIGFLDALELDSVHYVGESVAAMLGVRAATLYPERFKSLTLVAMPPRMLGKDAELSEDRLSAGGTDRTTALREQGVGAWAEGLMVPGKFAGLDGEPERREWLIGEWGKTPTHVATALMECVMGFEVESLLGELEVPTLVLAPARSALQPLGGQVAIRDAINGARIAVIDGPGHEIYIDRPGECAAALRTFLNGLPAAMVDALPQMRL
jgi:pimeloyl-ACP methyl ester carboxylesterase